MKNMGKKLSSNQASTKISKEDKKKQQHQLNTMIKILRPKVYITHSSDFKRLAQELTGNGSNNNSSPVTTPPLSSTALVAHQTTSPEFSIDVSSNTSSNNNNNNNNNIYDVDILSYDSPSGESGIAVPENLYSMLLDDEGCLQNDIENHYIPSSVPPYSSDDLVSLSPPSSSSCDWQLEMMDPFIGYNNSFYDFNDACYNSFGISKDQTLPHQQEAYVFENIELLQW